MIAARRAHIILDFGSGCGPAGTMFGTSGPADPGMETMWTPHMSGGTGGGQERRFAIAGRLAVRHRLPSFEACREPARDRQRLQRNAGPGRLDAECERVRLDTLQVVFHLQVYPAQPELGCCLASATATTYA